MATNPLFLPGVAANFRGATIFNSCGIKPGDVPLTVVSGGQTRTVDASTLWRHVSPPGDRVLITGALGQIGTDLYPALTDLHGKRNVIPTDIRKPDVRHPCHRASLFCTLDVQDIYGLRSLIREHCIGRIYHLAAILSAAGEKNPGLCTTVNFGGTLSVLNAAAELGIKVFIPSSIAVLPPVPSTSPQLADLDPKTTYGQTKAAGEDLALLAAVVYGAAVVGIRFPGLISYTQIPGGGSTDYAVEAFHAALRGAHYTFFVGPDARVPMMYMPDAVRAAIELMDAPLDSLSPCALSGYNIGGCTFTAEELARAIKKRIPTFTYDFKPDERDAIVRGWPNDVDDAMARRDWGWRPRFGLEEMVDDMIHNLRATVAPG